jgi:UDP-N-acetyl-D-mannosaminuronic acid dehydrogenase
VPRKAGTAVRPSDGRSAIAERATLGYDVCIIGGCGHAGLPLSIAFAIRGKRVVICDTDAAAAAKVRSGCMPFMEADGTRALRQALSSGNLAIANSPQVVSDSDAVVLVVGTPIDHHLAPSFREIEDVLTSYRPYFRSGQLLILRSTMYPGTSHRVLRWLKAARLEMDLAVCPERIAQGFALREIFSLPQIVGAFTAQTFERTAALFRVLTTDLVEMTPTEAELAKLFTNTWRYIKFAVANQFLTIAHECGEDFDRIYRGMTHHYARAEDLPRPGFTAGPCLFKDTMQLSAFTNNQFFLGHAAMLVNEGLPYYIVSHMRHRYDLHASTVAILGMAFKADVDDVRDSLSFKLKALLELEAQRVVCSDPYVERPDFVSTQAATEQADILVIATPHRQYRSLRPNGKPVVDIWNVLGRGTQL